jgi:hypothetical protein
MSAVILALGVVAMVIVGFLAVFVVLLIGMRSEGSQLIPTNESHTRTESMARRILGLYVRREIENTSAERDVRR